MQKSVQKQEKATTTNPLRIHRGSLSYFYLYSFQDSRLAGLGCVRLRTDSCFELTLHHFSTDAFIIPVVRGAGNLLWIMSIVYV